MEFKKKPNFTFNERTISKFRQWTGLSDTELEEALLEITGNTYFHMRKLTSLILGLIEGKVSTEKYSGYLNGKKLTPEQKKCIKEIPEEMKEEAKEMIHNIWKSMLTKQNAGIDRFSLLLSRYLNNDSKN